jgi:hypothetical protein
MGLLKNSIEWQQGRLGHYAGGAANGCKQEDSFHSRWDVAKASTLRALYLLEKPTGLPEKSQANDKLLPLPYWLHWLK